MIRASRWTGYAVASLLCITSPMGLMAQDRQVEAAKKGNVRADARAAEADGTTALHWAVQRDDVATVDELLRAGAPAAAPTRYGVTPISLAALNGNAATLALLLKAGVNPNSTLPGGETALMTAARTGNPSAITMLVSHGADVNAKETTRGQTALMWAAGEGHADAIKALLAHGADMKARETSGWSAFLFAVRAGHTDAVRAFLEAGADPSEAVIPPAGGGRGRGRGAGAGAGGAAPGRRGGAGPTGGPSALQLAVANAHYELGSLLLDKGANAGYAGQGWTALQEIIPLRRPGRTLEAPPPKGSGNVDSLDLVRKLVSRGTNINHRAAGRPPLSGPTALNLSGGTAFFLASRTCDVPLLRLLVELGADPLMPNEDDSTPLMAAAGVGTASVGEDAGIEPECVEATKLTLALGNDINAVDKNGNTAMHGAAFRYSASIVKLLAENGAKIDIWNRNNVSGWTPLRIAVGVHRGMNFRFSPPTAAALRDVHRAAGVSTEPEPEAVISGGTPTK